MKTNTEPAKDLGLLTEEEMRENPGPEQVGKLDLRHARGLLTVQYNGDGFSMGARQQTYQRAHHTLGGS